MCMYVILWTCLTLICRVVSEKGQENTCITFCIVLNQFSSIHVHVRECSSEFSDMNYRAVERYGNNGYKFFLTFLG